MLTIQHLSAGYRGHPVVTDACFTVPKGAMVAVLGENGAGKSTLLKTIAGLLPPIAGDVLLHQQALLKMSLEQRAKKISVVLPLRQFDTTLRAREVLLLGRSPYTSHWGTITEQDQSVIGQVTERLNLFPLLEKPIFNLSDGERQKVMMGRALVQQTDMLLLDEPTAFLDFRNRKYIFELLKEEALNGKIVLCSTHDVHDVLRVATHLLLVQKGRPVRFLENQTFSEEEVIRMLHQ